MYFGQDQHGDGCGLVPDDTADPVGSSGRLSDDDLRWLPVRGEAVIVQGTLIVACDCDGPPFYRLSRSC